MGKKKGGDKGGAGSNAGKRNTTLRATPVRPANGPLPLSAPSGFSTPTSVISNVKRIENEFIKKNSQASGSDRKLPVRPAHGQHGTAIQVWANYFEVVPEAQKTLSYYPIQKIRELDEDTNEEKDDAEVRKLSPDRVRRLIQLLIQEDQDFSDAVTDFAGFLILPSKLANNSKEITFRNEFENNPKPGAPKYRVTLGEASDVSASEFLTDASSTNMHEPARKAHGKTIQALNTAVSMHARNNPRLGNGRPIYAIFKDSIFRLDDDTNNQTPLNTGRLVLRGLFRSVRAATGRILLNVNVSHCAVHESLDLATLFGKIELNDMRAVQARLRKLRISRTHLLNYPGEKKIWSLSSEQDGQGDDIEHATRFTPGKDKFGAGPKDVYFWYKKRDSNGIEVSAQYKSVFDYFGEVYPTFELNENYPVVNIVYLPAEVCEIIPGQLIKGILNPEETNEVMKFAVRTPDVNKDWICSSFKKILGIDENTNDGLAKLGIKVGEELITVSARELGPPSVLYKTKSSAKIVNGSWNLSENKFHTGAKVKACTFIWFQSTSANALRAAAAAGERELPPWILSQEAAQKCINKFSTQMSNNGVIERALAKEGPGSDLLILILPFGKDAILYRTIKTLCDTKIGIGKHSICMLEENLAKKNDYQLTQYFANVAMKVNQKMGGINHILDPKDLGIIGEGKTMVVGLDVTHPAPGAENEPSVAGIVASVDKELSKWPAALRVQQGRTEMVTDLQEMFKSRLSLWKRQKANSGRLPENIIMYRDGVSEGQYDTVLEKELPTIEEACKETYKNYEKGKLPKISIIIVGKRHHTRFYPKSPESVVESGNCKPGTIVDRGVTEVRNWDFFLQAHDAIKGTARPAHYYVILDEIFGPRYKNNSVTTAADALEKLTHNMCYLFSRATKAVSICPPAYYADILCTRARCYLPNSSDSGTSGNDGEEETDANEVLREATQKVQIHENLVDEMFYI